MTPEECQRAKAQGLPCGLTRDEDVANLGLQNFETWLGRIKSYGKCGSNVCNLPCRLNNTGAMIIGSHARKWGATTSRRAADGNATAYFPTVVQGFAAHVDLLRKYCGKYRRCTIAKAVSRWAMANRWSYTKFISNGTGISPHLVYNPNDPNIIGKIAAIMACHENGGFPYNQSDIKKGLAYAFGKINYTPPPNVGMQDPISIQDGVGQVDPISPYSNPEYQSPDPTFGGQEDPNIDPTQSQEDMQNYNENTDPDNLSWKDEGGDIYRDNMDNELTASSTDDSLEDWNATTSDEWSLDTQDENYNDSEATNSYSSESNDSDTLDSTGSNYTQNEDFSPGQNRQNSEPNQSQEQKASFIYYLAQPVSKIYNAINSYPQDTPDKQTSLKEATDLLTNSNLEEQLLNDSYQDQNQSNSDISPSLLKKPWQRHNWVDYYNLPEKRDKTTDLFDGVIYPSYSSGGIASERKTSSAENVGIMSRVWGGFVKAVGSLWDAVTNWQAF